MRRGRVVRRVGIRASSLPSIVLVAVLMGHAVSASAQEFVGVNLSGAEFGESQLPGSYGSNYIYPTPAEIDYYLDQGMNVFRIPFRWERLQRSLSAAFDGTESARLQNVVAYATGQGAYVILDPHNYARYYGALVGQRLGAERRFANFWSRLAAQYKSNPRVIFGLMNEPHGMPTEQWVAAANAAIAAIRAAGAQNLILVPGNGWTGAHSWSDSWYGTPNAVAMLNIVDPATTSPSRFTSTSTRTRRGRARGSPARRSAPSGSPDSPTG